MVLELDKEDLVNLVKGIYPRYKFMDKLLKDKLGTYVGGFREDFTWNHLELMGLSEPELYMLYKKLKK